MAVPPFYSPVLPALSVGTLKLKAAGESSGQRNAGRVYVTEAAGFRAGYLKLPSPALLSDKKVLLLLNLVIRQASEETLTAFQLWQSR